MDDAISREQAIKATWQDTGYTDPFNVMTAIRDRIKQLPPIHTEPHWIPVTERLPEKDGEYLTTWIDAQKKLCVNVFLVENGVWYWNQKYLFPNWRIIAWMPLPEPFNEVTE